MKRINAVILSLILMLNTLVFTGCSKDEKELTDILQEMNVMDKYERSGTLNFNFEVNDSILKFYDNVILSLDYEDSYSEDKKVKQHEKIIELLKNLNITYNIKKIKENKVDMIFYMKNNQTGKDEILTRLLHKDDCMYIKVDKIVQIINSTLSDEILKERINKAFENVEYIKLSKEDINDLSSDNYYIKLIYKYIILGVHVNSGLSSKFENTLIESLDGLNTNFLKKEGNKYIINLDSEKTINTYFDLLEYYLNNIEKIGSSFNKFAKFLDKKELMNMKNILTNDEEYAKLMTDEDVTETKNSIKEEIDYIKDDVLENKEQYLQELQEIKNGDELDMFKSFIDGSNINMVFEKTKDNEYKIDSNVSIRAKKLPMFTIDLKTSDIIRKIDDFNYDEPSKNVETIEGLQKIIQAIPTTIIISTDSEQTYETSIEDSEETSSWTEYYYTTYNELAIDSGYLNSIIENNTTYVYLREISNLFDESVGWDDQFKKAYIEKDNKRIYFEGILRNNGETGKSIFIKVRDLEKLGYKIEYNDTNKTIKITQPIEK